MAHRKQTDAQRSLILQFCIHLKASGKASATVACYRSDLVDFFNKVQIADVDSALHCRMAADRAAAFRERLLDRFVFATANRKLSALNAFFAWANRTGRLKHRNIPELRQVTPQVRQRERPRILTAAQQAKLLDTAGESNEARAFALLALMLGTGIRISELRKLRWQDVKLEDGKSTICYSNSKSGRLIVNRINDACREAMKRLQESTTSDSDSPVFKGRSGPLTRSQIVNILERYFTSLGLNDAKPEILRITYEANQINEGVDPYTLAYLMGYSRLTAPQKRYSGLCELAQCRIRREQEKRVDSSG